MENSLEAFGRLPVTRGRVFKTDKSRAARLKRLLLSVVDPRAFAHALKVVNYYNYTHAAPLREVTLGGEVNVSPTVSFTNGRNIEIGAGTRIGANVSLWGGPGRGRIVIGRDVLIAPNVMLTAANYRFDDGSPVTAQAMDEGDIVVGDDVWIGAGAVVLPGVRIGAGAIVGAGSVLRDDVAPFAVVAGNPARPVGARRRGEEGRATLDRAAAPAEGLLDLVTREAKIADRAELARPLEQTSLDSFDLMTLRTAIEARHDRSIPDREWGAIETLEDIARLPSLAGGAATCAAAPAAAGAAASAGTAPAGRPAAPEAVPVATGRAGRRYALNMPQMALAGLSESWAFKEVGDIHWAMIADFLGQPTGAIRDETGARLYATFTRIRIEAESHLRGFSENDEVALDSRLERFGASFYFGEHELAGPAARLRAQTMSTFAKYGERGANTSLIKGAPVLPESGAIPALGAFPDFGAEYRARRAGEEAAPIWECDYEIQGPHDINGVGLLYFAAYPLIADICIARHEAECRGGAGFLLAHATVSKDVFYFANSEPDEVLRVRLHARAAEEDGIVRHTVSLARGSDGKTMAVVESVKRRVGRHVPQ